MNFFSCYHSTLRLANLGRGSTPSSYVVLAAIDIATTCSRPEFWKSAATISLPYMGVPSGYVLPAIPSTDQLAPLFSLLELPPTCAYGDDGPSIAFCPVSALTTTLTYTATDHETSLSASQGGSINTLPLLTAWTSFMACYLSSETTLKGTSSSSAMSSAIQKPSAPVENASPMLTVVETFMSSRKVGGFVIASQTLIPGGPAITVSGSPISLPTSAGDLTVGGTTYVFVSKTQHALLNPSPLTIGGSVITPSTGSNYIIGSQTLMPGGLAINISGTLISFAPSASEIVIGSTTHKLASAVGRVQPPHPL